MSDTAWFVWGVPAAALVVGGFVFLLAWLSSRDFDRRYGGRPK